MCKNTHIARTSVTSLCKEEKPGKALRYDVDTNSYFCTGWGNTTFTENTTQVTVPGGEDWEVLDFGHSSTMDGLGLILSHYYICEHLKSCKDPENCQVLTNIVYPGVDCIPVEERPELL